MRSSRNCPLKLQASIATQSQILLDLDILASQPLAPTASSVPVLTAPITSPVLATPIASTVLATPIVSTVPRQLSPDRPEVLIQAYLVKNEAWLEIGRAHV